MKISWGIMPVEIRQAVEPFVDSLPFPGWVNHVRFESAPDKKGRYAYTIPAYEYRQTTITVYPRFLDLDSQGRRLTLVHEAVHAALSQLHLIAVELKDRFVEDEKAKAFIGEQIRLALESATEDVAQMLTR